MRKFNITVNGTAYEVEVEEVTAGAAVQTTPAAPATAAAPAPKAAAPKAAPAHEGKAGAKSVNAPMPGTILAINVIVGQQVKKGDVVCVLEAMKMENDIPAPEDGVVASINVQKGSSINSGDVIVTLN